MMTEKIKAGFGNKPISFEAKRLPYQSYWLGLMFRTRNTENLLFDLPGRWGIHSFFVFFSFLAVWLDEKNKVLDWRIVRPFTFLARPRKKFAKLAEIPVNKRNRLLLSNFTTTRERFKYLAG